jgi:hypothetical protein
MKALLRNSLLVAAVGGITWLGSDRAAAFSYFSYGGYSVIWYDGYADRYLSTITFQEGDDPDVLYRASMGQWSDVWGSSFYYRYGYVDEADTVIDPQDGYSMTVAVPADSLDPGVLAVTYMVNYMDEWYDMDMVFADVPDGVGWHMLTNPDFEVTGNPEPDNGFSFYLVALHELGHAIGLGHDPVGDEPAGTSWLIGTLNPGYPAGGPIGNQNIIELHADDRRGTRFLYPGSSAPTIDLGNAGYSARGPRLGRAEPSFFTPSPITPDQELTLWATIENFGNVAVSNVRQGFYLSTNNVIDANDLALGHLFWNLGTGTSCRIEFGAATDIPDLPAGTYYVGSILDDLHQVTEEYEDNNQADYCAPLLVAQAVPAFGSFSQYIITCENPFTGPTPVVTYPINMAPLTWSLDNPQPGMTVDPNTGVIHWPSPVKSPFIYEIVLRATNGAGTSTQTVRLGVQQAPPHIVAIANHATKCGFDYTGPTPALTAPACMAPILGWSLVAGPPGMTINTSSGVVSWPDADPVNGPYVVTIRAINAVGEATESWILYVASADGDLDANGVVDVADLRLFAPCVHGPQLLPATGCVCSDFDGDNDTDLLDYARMMLVFSGATIREGACCFEDGNCSAVTVEHCYALGGYYRGDGTTCAGVSCSGACCFYTGGCLNFTLEYCNIAGGTFQGMGSLCAQLTCPSSGKGACCWPNQSCTLVTPAACASGGGNFRGVGLSCAAVDCSSPVGACCHTDGACSVGSQNACTLTGGTYMGNQTTCTAGICNGACCYPNGACLDLSITDCTTSAGVFEGPLTACATFQCPVETVGACCHTDDTCTEETAVRCAGYGGSYQGDNTTCATAHCTVRGACCLPTEVCAVITSVACAWQNGTYFGQSTVCTGVDCSLSEVGACYNTTDWTCRITGHGICTALGGTFEGAGTTCTNTMAPEYRNTIANPTTYYSPGANKALGDDMTLAGTARGLTYYDLAVAGTANHAYNVTAALYTNCPGLGGTLIAGTQRTWNGVPGDDSIYLLSADFSTPVRVPDSVWMVVTFSTADSGWVVAEQAETGSTQNIFGQNDPPWACDYWFGPPPADYAGFWADIQCVAIPEAQGACCHTDHTCTQGTIPACTAFAGLFMGEGTTCATVNCASITVGACCDIATWTCTMKSAADCTAAGGSFDGVGTSCTGACPEYRNEINPVTLSYNPGKPMADDLTLAGTARDLIYFEVAVYGGGGGPFDLDVALYNGSPCSGGTILPGTLVSGAGLPDGQVLNLTVTLPAPVTLPNTVWMVMEFSTAYAGWIVAETAEAGSTANVFGLAAYDGQQWTWTCNNTVDGAYAGFWVSLQCIDAGKSARGGTVGAPMLQVTPIATPLESVRLVHPADEIRGTPGTRLLAVPAATKFRAAPVEVQPSSGALTPTRAVKRAGR